jgi:hypothetical protein
MSGKLLSEQGEKLLVIVIFILTFISSAQAQSTPQSRPNEIRISIVRFAKDSNVEEVIKDFSMLTKDFELVDAPIVGGPIIKTPIKIEQFKVSLKQDDSVQLRLESTANRPLTVEAIALLDDAEIMTLFKSGRDEITPGKSLKTGKYKVAEDMNMRFIIAITTDRFQEIDFSEGLSFGRGAKQIAGAAMLSNLGAVYESRGQFEKSIEFYESYILLTKAALKPLEQETRDSFDEKLYQGKIKEEAAANNNLGLLWYF